MSKQKILNLAFVALENYKMLLLFAQKEFKNSTYVESRFFKKRFVYSNLSFNKFLINNKYTYDKRVRVQLEDMLGSVHT